MQPLAAVLGGLCAAALTSFVLSKIRFFWEDDT